MQHTLVNPRLKSTKIKKDIWLTKIHQVFSKVYGRFPDGYFPGWFFQERRFPDSRFPDSHFLG